MKNIAYLLGVLLIVVAAIYLLVPADQLPAFFRAPTRRCRASGSSTGSPRRGRRRADRRLARRLQSGSRFAMLGMRVDRVP